MCRGFNFPLEWPEETVGLYRDIVQRTYPPGNHEKLSRDRLRNFVRLDQFIFLPFIIVNPPPPPPTTPIPWGRGFKQGYHHKYVSAVQGV